MAYAFLRGSLAELDLTELLGWSLGGGEMRALLFATFCAFGVSACATPPASLVEPCPSGTAISDGQIQLFDIGGVLERRRILSNVALMQTAQANVGDIVVESAQEIEEYRAFRTASFATPQSFSGPVTGLVPIESEVVGVFSSAQGNTLLVRVNPAIRAIPFYYAQIGADGALLPELVRDYSPGAQDDERIRYSATQCISPHGKDVRFDRVPATLTSRNVAVVASAELVVGSARLGTRFEIVYNGIDGSSVRFQYREYTEDDMARPAFFQDLTYPIDTETIAFRDLRIRLLAVTANSIEYQVVSGPLRTE